MSWPLSQDYNEAIQDPLHSFSDAELKTGEAVANALGIPMPRSGNFADVYEVRCPSGSRWAVKCFTREVYGLAERYSEISKYLRLSHLPFMVDFKYLEQGMRVRGQWYPILKMQWVEGFVLNEFVRDNLDKKPILQGLSQIWLRMARRLRESYIAHCDLQHGNVMFVPGSKSSSLAVKLIDYDGMCVPSLVGTKSGEVGHPAYQHPERLRTGAYNQEVDRFSLLCIATALRCLTIGGKALWERYDTGDNLLFRQADLQAPGESPLFQELMAIGDPQTQKLVTELHRACQGSLEAVPLLTDLLPEEKPAGKVTKTVTAAAAVPQQVAGAPGPDWDFGGEEPGASVVKKRRKAGGTPMWAWGAMGGTAALMLLCVGVGVGLFLRKGPAENEDTPVAQHKPEVKPSKRSAKEPPPDEAPHHILTPDNPARKPPANREASADLTADHRIFLLAPAGDTLAIADERSNTWRLIDPRTNRLLHQFTGHTGPITGLAFSADGRRAVTSGDDGMLRLWNVQTGQTVGTRRVQGKRVVGIALSPDGNKVATVDGGVELRLWDFEAKKGNSYDHDKRNMTSVAFSPDGRYLAFGFDKSDKVQDDVLVLWPLAKGLASRGFRSLAQEVKSIAVSPDGKYVAVSYSDQTRVATLWEAATGRRVREFSMAKGPIHQVAFSPDSRFLLVSATNRYQIWPVKRSPNGGFTGMGTSDTRQDLIVAAFTPASSAVTFVYVKAGHVTRAQTVRLPAMAFPAKSPPAKGQTTAWEKVDPDGDCKFKEANGKLTIAIPKDKPHDLAVENGNMNGPRLLRDIEGDFTVEVRVSADFQESRIQASGLFLMVDNQTYIRLERGRFRGDAVRLWEMRRDGKPVPPNFITKLSKEEGYLRLERRGNKVLAFVSEDGETWDKQKPLEIDLPRKVKIGVSAISVSGAFAATFDHFQIKQGQGEWVHLDKWLTAAVKSLKN